MHTASRHSQMCVVLISREISCASSASMVSDSNRRSRERSAAHDSSEDCSPSPAAAMAACHVVGRLSRLLVGWQEVTAKQFTVRAGGHAYRLVRRVQVCNLCNRTHLAHLLKERPLREVTSDDVWEGPEVAARFKINGTIGRKDHHLQQGRDNPDLEVRRPPCKADLFAALGWRSSDYGEGC